MFPLLSTLDLMWLNCPSACWVLPKKKSTAKIINYYPRTSSHGHCKDTAHSVCAINSSLVLSLRLISWFMLIFNRAYKVYSEPVGPYSPFLLRKTKESLLFQGYFVTIHTCPCPDHKSVVNQNMYKPGNSQHSVQPSCCPWEAIFELHSQQASVFISSWCVS